MDNPAIGPTTRQPTHLYWSDTKSPLPPLDAWLPQILTGLPVEGLVVETDDPNFSFGDDTSVVAVDACSGLEVPVVSEVSFGM